MAPLHRLDLHGPTLAVLLQSVLTAGRACDGVLLGSVATTTSVQAEDAQGRALEGWGARPRPPALARPARAAACHCPACNVR
jgi:hypothetical protein